MEMPFEFEIEKKIDEVMELATGISKEYKYMQMTIAAGVEIVKAAAILKIANDIQELKEVANGLRKDDI